MPRQKSTHVDDPAAVGRRLKEAREQAGLSQRELAFSGCSAAYISRIEKGDRIPSLQLLRELGKRLGVTADYLATGEEESARDLLFEAELALRMDDREVAEALLEDVLSQEQDPVRRGRALAARGQLALLASDPTAAIPTLEEACRLLGDGVLEHQAAVVTLSDAHALRGDRESATAVLERALDLARAREDSVARARFAVLLASMLVDRGDLARAEELLTRVIAESDETAQAESLARLYWVQSRLHIARGAFDLASSYARRTMAALELSENAHHFARAHHLLAYIELERGDADEALRLLEKGRPLVEEAGDRSEIALFRLEEARALLALGRLDEARELALAVLGELGGVGKFDAARATTVVADVLAASGDRAHAIELYEGALEHMGHSPFALDAYRRLADLLEAEGRRDEAFELLKRAVTMPGDRSKEAAER
jgi:transcriptional regulator with XRE-family HTH domain/predicted negative regulator of RcsB-dependent stress response